MARLSSAFHWIRDRWWIPFLILVAVLAILAFRKWRPKEDPFQGVKDELRAIQAGTDARNMAIQLGTEQATEHVRDKYQARIAALDAQQQAQVAELEDDPVELAKYLERLSR